MSLNKLETQLLEAIDESKDEIIAIAREVEKNPELGFKEIKTSDLIKKIFSKFGIPFTDGHAITGVKAKLGNGGYNVGIIGEMDSVVNHEHPSAVFPTGAVHACGHNGQVASMLGAAIGFAKSGVLQHLSSGTVSFFAVPAEEYIETEYRNSLKDKGLIKFFSGKQQMLYEGAFDGIDAAMMVHAQPDTPKAKAFIHSESLGFVMKNVIFKGKSVHAAKPFDGVNALNAAALAILGIHTNRERFRDEDKVRVHFIITKGGDIVNAVPSEVCLECQVRAANMTAMQKAAEETDNAIKGAAMMVGAEVEIKTSMGYQPFNQDKVLGNLFGECASEFIGEENVISGVDMTGSSDIGDLSMLLPTIQPMFGGFTGQLHSKEFKATDEYTAYVLTAKIMALTALRLLENDGVLCKKIKDGFTPILTKEEYIKLLED